MVGSEQDETFATVRKLNSRDRDRQLRSVLEPIGPSLRGKTKGIDANEILLNEQTPPEFETLKGSPKRSPTIDGQRRSEGSNRSFRTGGQAANMDVKLILGP